MSKENAFLLEIEFKIVIFISVEWDLRTNYCETTTQKKRKEEKNSPNMCVCLTEPRRGPNADKTEILHIEYW